MLNWVISVVKSLSSFNMIPNNIMSEEACHDHFGLVEPNSLIDLVPRTKFFGGKWSGLMLQACVHLNFSKFVIPTILLIFRVCVCGCW